MNKNKFEKKINDFIPELFSFAYAIVPDDLQAQQVVVDALVVLSVHEKQLINSIILTSENDVNMLNSRVERLRERLYKYVYTVAAKRFSQLKNSLLNKNEYALNLSNLFFELSVEERTSLYLHEYTKLSFEAISNILDLDYEDYKIKLNLSRNKLLLLVGHQNSVLPTNLIF